MFLPPSFPQAVLGGNAAPKAADIKKILTSGEPRAAVPAPSALLAGQP